MHVLGTWIRPVTLILAAVPLLHAQDGDMAERLYRSGERAYAAHSYPEALETWNQLVAQLPQSPFAARALLSLARHQMDVEKKPEAATPFLEKLKNEYLKTPQAGDALLLLGRRRAARSHAPADIKEALADFNRLVDLFPDHPLVQEARLQMGLARKLQGEWGRALQAFTEAMRMDPASPAGIAAQLQAAETLDIMGDLTGCLRMLQDLRNRHPQAPEAQEAQWRIQVRVLQRLQKPALKSMGPWPQGRTKWLKTPTLLATGPEGGLYLYQSDDDRAYHFKDGALVPSGPVVKGGKALLVPAPGTTWVVSAKFGLVKEDAPQPAAPPLPSPSGGMLDTWGNAWICDPGSQVIQVLAGDAAPRPLPVPAVQALAPLPDGGAAAASDATRTLLFLDAAGRTRASVPYGKDLPASFKYVVSLASDPLGHVAALVDGDFEGVVVWGPDGSVLRSATYKTLGIAGKFRAVALDRAGGLILADRSNDLLIRLQ
ncbi:tetratricopeptide repeat protein [Geothrix sp. 21YS21S-2]|uniref:tetratricopeptide repeat protein n=1 Tax=Geothrix sp. 21YS21S-2 TaxID=3068893 RepID=UPI0027B9D3C2|nr:tetratricopeptide repeat protein [Geothrix sp. 21YS21S-2]